MVCIFPKQASEQKDEKTNEPKAKIMKYTYVDSPIGPLLLTGYEDVLTGLHFSTGSKATGPHEQWERQDDVFKKPAKQLQEYFDGKRKVFDLEPKQQSYHAQPFKIKKKRI